MNIDSSPSFSKPLKPTAATSGVQGVVQVSVQGAAQASTSGKLNAVASVNAFQSHAAEAQLLSTHADFDAAKVAEIRASISAGSYVVNTSRIADGLIASAQELLHTPPR